MHWTQLLALFRRPKPPTSAVMPAITPAHREPHTHDYTFRIPGHDYTIQRIDSSGNTLRAIGFGPFHGKIQRDDYLTLAGPTNPRYRVTSIIYRMNPPDMWDATLVYEPNERGQ